MGIFDQPEESSTHKKAEAAFCEATRLHGEGNQDKAMELLKLSLELDPDHLQARIAASWAFAGLQQWDEAVSHANHAVRLSPDDEDVHQAAFRIYAGKGDDSLYREHPLDAFNFLSKALLFDPTNADAGKVFEAMRDIVSATLQDGEVPDIPLAQHFVQICYQTLEKVPDWNGLRFALGMKLLHPLERWEEAFEMFRECVERDPDYKEAKNMFHMTKHVVEKKREREANKNPTSSVES